MKKAILFPLCLFIASTLFVSCKKGSPKDVAQTWLTGFNRMDFEEAMKVSTSDTKSLLGSLQQLTDKVSDSAKQELKKVTVKIKDVKENGDKAVVTYTTSDNANDQTLNLVKQNDKWLVQFSKTDLVGDIAKDEPQPVEGDNTAADTTGATADSAKATAQ